MIKTRGAAELAAKQLAACVAELGQVVADRDAQVQKVMQGRAPLIEKIQREIEAIRTELAAWSKENRKAEFGEAQSLDLRFAVLRFRLGNRRLDLYAGWEWPDVLNAMTGALWKRYIKRMPTIDKALILRESKLPAEADGPKPKLTAEELRAIGVRVEQGESFEVEARPDMIGEEALQ